MSPHGGSTGSAEQFRPSYLVSFGVVHSRRTWETRAGQGGHEIAPSYETECQRRSAGGRDVVLLL